MHKCLSFLHPLIACVWFGDQVGWVVSISYLVERDGSNPVLCLVAEVEGDGMDGILTPLVTCIHGAHLSSIGPTCHPLLFFFFFPPHL
jgi:hypothetical protein